MFKKIIEMIIKAIKKIKEIIFKKISERIPCKDITNTRELIFFIICKIFQIVKKRIYSTPAEN